MDFVSDSLHDGRRFRIFTLVDHFTRESPAIEVGNSIPGKRVVAVLEWLARSHGLPQGQGGEECERYSLKPSLAIDNQVAFLGGPDSPISGN